VPEARPSKEEFDVTKLAITEGPFRRTMVQRYHLKAATVRRA
jgi:hypothetical protein